MRWLRGAGRAQREGRAASREVGEYGAHVREIGEAAQGAGDCGGSSEWALQARLRRSGAPARA